MSSPSPVASDAVRARRAARQWLEAGRLMGVDIVPRAVRRPVAAVEPKPSAPPASSGDAAPADALAALEALYRREVADVWDEHPFTNPVFGHGAPTAPLMIVGEAPGADEDRTGLPFQGRAGHKLDEMIKAMGRRREDLYIANVCKIRPPGNRTPLEHEVARDAPFLRAQIAVIRPVAILALGGPASKWLLDTSTGITRLRGTWGTYVDPEDASVAVPVMPTFHPAYLLRQPTREVRERMWHDLQAVMRRLEEAGV